ncbi:MAG: hypothetical protein AB7P76_08250 [Candidatus Melainabacteria bacterium]
MLQIVVIILLTLGLSGCFGMPVRHIYPDYQVNSEELAGTWVINTDNDLYRIIDLQTGQVIPDTTALYINLKSNGTYDVYYITANNKKVRHQEQNMHWSPGPIRNLSTNDPYENNVAIYNMRFYPKLLDPIQTELDSRNTVFYFQIEGSRNQLQMCDPNDDVSICFDKQK